MTGAPYSAVGIVELRLICELANSKYTPVFRVISESLTGCTYWQYGNGARASQKRCILGHVDFQALTDDNNTIIIRHLILEGSSQWILGKIVTNKFDIIQLNGNALKFTEMDQMIHYRCIPRTFNLYHDGSLYQSYDLHNT